MQPGALRVPLRGEVSAHPFVREGQLYSPDSLERYLELPAGDPDRVMAVVDTKGAGEFFACLSRDATQQAGLALQFSA